MKASTKGYRHGYLKDWYGQSQVGGHVHLAVFLFLLYTICKRVRFENL